MGLLDSMPEDDRRKLKRIVIFVGGALAVMFVVFAILDVQDANRREQLEPWAAMVRDHVLAAKGPAEALDPKGGYVTGRLLPVNWARREVDHLYFDIPPTLRSQTPTDVGTYAWLQYGQKQVGKYNNGDPAYVQTAKITVIDKAKNTIVARAEVQGGPPPETKTSGGSGTGSHPGPQVLGYLMSLPTR